MSVSLVCESGLTPLQIEQALLASLQGQKLNKVLLVPPDFTRLHSNAGYITNVYYHALCGNGCKVDIIPALGTHAPMSKGECAEMFGDIPFEAFLVHNWRTDVITLGTVSGEFLEEISGGVWTEPIQCQVNKILFSGYDLIISIGQVVPHEVIGMANHAKNLFVGLGGKHMIDRSHMLGALYGMEKMMGKDNTPVRKLLDYCLTTYLSALPIMWVLTVTTAPEGNITTHGLFIGNGRQPLCDAITLAQKDNLTVVKPIKKCIVYLDGKEYKSTWLGNKAIYRTRMALADGAELIVLGEGVCKFGEDAENDRLIRKYGYIGREAVLKMFPSCQEMQNNMGMTAHLIHGSSDGRFNITYATTLLSKQEIEQVNFRWADYNQIIARYNVSSLVDGFNNVNGEEIFYISNPALGLWIAEGRI